MIAYMLTGQMAGEVDRVAGSRTSSH
jgi:hypothetical protein